MRPGISPGGEQTIEHPGRTGDLDVQPDHGEDTYRGAGRLEGRRTVITGGDSGIGRVVAIAYVREFGRIDVLVSNAAMKTTVYALFRLARAAVPHSTTRRRRRPS